LLQTLSGHSEYVVSAAYSPDATRIVTASIDATARIWDARTGRQVAVLDGHQANLRSAAYSPDGSHIVTTSMDTTARIWDARSATPLGVIKGHSDWVYSGAYSPDGRHIVTASRDSTARLWDADTLSQEAVFKGHAATVFSARFSPDGSRLVTASGDQTVRIWDVRTGAQLVVLADLGTSANFAAYSPDGRRIVAALSDGTARIWDAHTGAQLAVLAGHTDVVRSAAFSPDGTRVITASHDHTARIWDAHDEVNLEAQILWERAAQTGAWSATDRMQLGLPPEPGVREWSTTATNCDQSASADYDPERSAPGTALDAIPVAVAEPACATEATTSRHPARAVYQLGRVLLAKGDIAGARRRLDSAASRHYRAARIDLADSYVNDAAQAVDPARAVALYESAWSDGITVAASRLGRLYEQGMPAAAVAGAGPWSPDLARAWQWYRRGADAGDPNSRARFAEREERDALAAGTPSTRDAHLLQAFIDYAAAAERARQESWPDAATRHWRYRRGSLARTLADDDQMQQVADAYAAVLQARTR
jgi:TPR repeat protein